MILTTFSTIYPPPQGLKKQKKLTKPLVSVGVKWYNIIVGNTISIFCAQNKGGTVNV